MSESSDDDFSDSDSCGSSEEEKAVTNKTDSKKNGKVLKKSKDDSMAEEVDSDSEEEAQPVVKKRKKLQDYLNEKIARQALEEAERQREEDAEEAHLPRLPLINPMNYIKNKDIRHKVFRKDRAGKKREDKKDRAIRKKTPGPRSTGHTIESLREKDQTVVANIESEEHDETRKEMELDEFSEYFNKAYEPKVLITYSDNPHSKTRGFGKELAMIIPNSTALTRHRSSVKKICESSTREGYTDVIIINENRKKINGLLLIHLPGGGLTAHFKVSNVKLTTDIKRKISNFTSHRPEVILTNFSTRLGITIGRMLGAIFHYDPQFRGRRAATFHNQRDYIFFRHHRYEFDKNGKRAKLLELGPRFTLKLQSLQQGIFDSKTGDYEWMITNKRHQMEGSRRRFYL